MPEEFDAVAELRPRIKRDVLFSETRNGVLFHNATAGFELMSKSGYRFAELVVPYLDGSTRVGDLCRGLPDAQRQMTATLVRALIDRGLAKNVPLGQADPLDVLSSHEAAEFAPQLGYIDHYSDEPVERFARFRNARVAVAGDDLVARWCALSLIRNGCAAVDVPPAITRAENAFADVLAEARDMSARDVPAAVTLVPGLGRAADRLDASRYDVVVCTGPDAPRRAFQLLSDGLPGHCQVLPVTVVGSRAVVGPAMSRSQRPCWACAALRIAANSNDEVADIWRMVCLPAAALDRAPRPPLAAMLGNQAGYEVFRLLTGAPPAETLGHVIIQNLDSLDAIREELLPHPGCPFCREPADAEGTTLVGVEPSAPAVTPLAELDDPQDLLLDLDDKSRLVSPGVGVFQAFDDDWLTQSPLRASRVMLAVRPGQVRAVAAFDLHTTAAARLRAVRAAAAVYAAHVAPPSGVLAGEALAGARRKLAAVDPQALSCGTGIQDREISEWTIAVPLGGGDSELVPAAAIHCFSPLNAAGVFAASSAGTGVSGTPEEACYLALFSALGAEALAAAISGSRPVRQVPSDALAEDQELRFLTASAANLDLGVEVLDLSGSGPHQPSVVLARATDPGTGSARWAVGSDAAWQQAASSALRDLVGFVQLGREMAGHESPDTGDPLLTAFDPRTLAVAGEYAPDPGAHTSAALVLEALRSAGRRALAVRVTPPDVRQVGLSIVRVVLAGPVTS